MILWACGDSAIVAPSCGTPYWSWHHGFVSKLAIGTIPSWHHLVPFHRAADLRCQLLFCGHFALGSDTLWHQFLNWLSCLSSKFNKIRKNMTEWIITTPWVLTFEISAGQMIDWNQFEWRMNCHWPRKASLSTWIWPDCFPSLICQHFPAGPFLDVAWRGARGGSVWPFHRVAAPLTSRARCSWCSPPGPV